jgi:DNA helicase-2/ATP-dependent DNA helicase PcrA
VGADDQSIYAWRGAESRNILEFSSHFPGATVIKLEENYRSTDVILSAANAVIAKNPRRHGKTLWTSRAGGAPIEVVACPDEQAEAAFVAEEIDRLSAQAKLSLRDVAVLYRSNTQTAPLEEALRQARIDYRVVGGQAFYDRKEVKDAIAYLKLLVYPHDEIALRRVINYPTRGIGPSTMERLGGVLKRLREQRPDVSLWELLLMLARDTQTDLFAPALPAKKEHKEHPDLNEQEEGMGPRVAAALRRFVETVQRHRGIVGQPPAELYKGLDGYLREMSVHDDLVRSGPSRIQAERRLRHLDDFLHGIERYAERPGFDLHAHLQRLALSAQDDDADDGLRDEVTLSTLHGAKGLEFRAVFLCGFEEELLPHRRSIESRPIDETLAGEEDGFAEGPGTGEAPPGGPAQIEEERRLCYVGITRARERLYLLHSRERKGRLSLRSPSRFLADIPQELLRLRDLELGAAVITDKAAEERFATESLSRLLELTGGQE